jgi:hypothetical protein
MNTFYVGLEVVKTLAALASAAGILTALRQFYLQRQVWLDTHERARREKAVSILRELTQAYNRQWAAAIKLVEQLDDDSLRKLHKGEPFVVKSDLVKFLIASLPSTVADTVTIEANGTVTLDEKQVFALQWEAFTCLNAIEVVFQAWHSDVADKNIIREQMRPLYAPKESRTMMRRLREIAGGKDIYPCIHAFIQEIEPYEKPQIPIGK